MSSHKAETIIIGGGIAGLACAHALLTAGRDVRVLDAADRVGGVMQTTQRDGFLLEHGPFNVLVKSPEFAALLEDLGPDASPIPVSASAKRNRYVYHSGALHRIPKSPGALTGSKLITWRGKARLVRGLISSAPGQPGASIDDVMRRRFGDEVADRIASAMTIGIWGAESDELEAASSMPALSRIDAGRSPLLAMLRARRQRRSSESTSNRSPSGMVSFRSGLGSMCDTIATRLGPCVETKTAATHIHHSENGWTIHATQHGARRTYHARHVVLACGAAAASTLFADDAPSLAAMFEQIDHVSLAVMNLALPRQAVDHPLDGYGFLVSRADRHVPVLGVLWASSVFPHHAPDDAVLLRVFFGGTRHPQQMRWSDDALVDASMDVLRPVLGVRGRPIFADVHRWPSAVPLYRPGHAAWTKRLRALADDMPGLHPAGSYLDGVSINDCVTRGVRTAQHIMADERNDPAAHASEEVLT